MSSTQKLSVVWVEDEQQYIQGIITALNDEFDLISRDEKQRHSRDIRIEMRVIRSCTEVLDEMENLLKDASVIILDLWLPSASPGEKNKVPNYLNANTANTARGIWLCEQVMKEVRKCERDIAILVMSGNLDTDTISSLERIGIPKDNRWKKPVEFDAFVARLVSMVKKTISTGSSNADHRAPTDSGKVDHNDNANPALPPEMRGGG